MLIRKYKKIMERGEEHRSKWAVSLSFGMTILIFMSFAFYKGFLSFGIGGGGAIANQNSQNQVANVLFAEKAPSPIQSTGQTFSSAFSEIGHQYQALKDSLSNVLVPFVTGIDVYNRQTP
jgi:hypothetical protein